MALRLDPEQLEQARPPPAPRPSRDLVSVTGEQLDALCDMLRARQVPRASS